MTPSSSLREQLVSIWRAGVDAVHPRRLFTQLTPELRTCITESHGKILVVGAGKAGSSMAEAIELWLADELHRVTGIINVPADTVRPLHQIRLHAARPAGSNHPTAEGVAGAEAMLKLFESATAEDVGVCLLSGGGSALLPAPVESISLADKQTVTKLLHACGASIHEMNAVRKHLSRIKGGGLAQAFRGKHLTSFIISDVVGDPLDVIASGPTAADSSTYADAIAILGRFSLRDRVPPRVLAYLEQGASGKVPETLKTLPPHVSNMILGNNAVALRVVETALQREGWRVLNLGSAIEGDTDELAATLAGFVMGLRRHQRNQPSPLCILLGGETTVDLGNSTGKGGRNQEFVLAMLTRLGELGIKGITILSGGTDGEDGPTDAAGAIADETTFVTAKSMGLSPDDFLQRHDAYHFFDAVGGLIRTGSTETNVMDIRMIVVANGTCG